MSDAETVAPVKKEREDNEAVFRRELAAIAPEDVLPTLDEYINELTKIQQSTLVGGSEKFEGRFQHLTLGNGAPRYIFSGNNSLAAKTGSATKGVEITVFGRPGAVDPAIYSYVRFMGISYNENFDIFTGTFVHRLPGSYQACVTVPVPQDALRLPYAQFAIDKYLTDRASMGLLGEIETRQKYCRNARVLAAESPSGRGMVFTLRERLPASRQNLLSETALSIVRLASVLPKTFVSKHPLVPNIAAEFYQRDNVLDARIFCTD